MTVEEVQISQLELPVKLFLLCHDKMASHVGNSWDHHVAGSSGGVFTSFNPWNLPSVFFFSHLFDKIFHQSGLWNDGLYFLVFLSGAAEVSVVAPYSAVLVPARHLLPSQNKQTY